MALKPCNRNVPTLSHTNNADLHRDRPRQRQSTRKHGARTGKQRARKMRLLLRRACHAVNLARERGGVLKPRLIKRFEKQRWNVIHTLSQDPKILATSF